MAATLRNNNVFLSSLMFLLIIGSSYAISSEEIKAICDKALNHSFCFTCLNARSSSPTIQALAQTIIETAEERTAENLKRLQDLINGDVDPRTKLGYRSCLENYLSARGNLQEAGEHLDSGDGAGMNMKISAAMDDAVTCLDDVKRLQVDATVSNNNNEVKNLCGIALVIANMLPKRV